MLLPILFLMTTRIAPQEATVPFRQPQLAAAHGQIAMTFGAGPAIYFTSSSDQGKTFGPPVKVAESVALALGRHRGPRIAILKNAIVISAIGSEKKGSGDLMVWRSTDGGKNWTKAGIVNDVPDSAREGLHAMAADANGNLFAAWLDLRSKGTKLYGARSTDGGLTWSKNVLIYASPGGTICQCCDPAIAIDETGRVSVMWRNALDGSRDFYTASSSDGAQFDQAKKLGTGTWKLDACPMDGGGLVVENGKAISAWRREGNIFLTGPDNKEKQIGAGKDVAIARSILGSFVAWTKGPALEILTPNAATPEPLSTAGAFVNLVALPDGSVLAAWEAHDSIETKRISGTIN